VRVLPDGWLDMLGVEQAVEPYLLALIWAEPGPEARLTDGRAFFDGGDPAQQANSNIALVNGSVVLAPGATVALPASSTPATGATALAAEWSVRVDEVGSWVWA